MLSFVQRFRASTALASLHHLETKAHLSGDDLRKRTQCVTRLAAIGPPAMPPLIRRLSNPNATAPGASIPLVVQSIGEPAVPYLAKAMHDGDSTVRHNAIALLGRLATESAIKELQDESVDLVDKEAVADALHEALAKRR